MEIDGISLPIALGLLVKLQPPPGTPMLPVTAARKVRTRSVSKAPSWWEIPALQKIAAGLALA